MIRAETPAHLPAAMQPAADAPGWSVLIIDDEPANLRVLFEMLDRRGFEVLTAGTAERGLRLAAEAQPDIILLDVLLPRIDGFECCRRLRRGASTRSIPVICISVLDDLDNRLSGLAAGAVDYVTKPFDAREVLLRLVNHLRLVAQARDPSAPAPEPEQALAQVAGRTDVGLLLRARDRLLENLAEPFDLAALARHAGTNRTTLNALFTEHLGLSAFAFLREQRLHRGRELLLATDLPIQCIAERVGYRNGRDFATAFRALFGVSPRALRQATRR